MTCTTCAPGVKNRKRRGEEKEVERPIGAAQVAQPLASRGTVAGNYVGWADIDIILPSCIKRTNDSANHRVKNSAKRD
jgi:hypothetical protein